MANDVLRKMRDGAAVIAAVAIPIIVAYLGNEINLSLKSSDVKMRTVELAISILRDDPKENDQSKTLREWAMDVIDKYSGIPLPEAARKELQEGPITRSKVRTIRCTRFAVSLRYKRPHTVVAIEDEESCRFYVNGAKQVTARCSNIPASVAAPFGVTVLESNGRCVFDVGDDY